MKNCLFILLFLSTTACGEKDGYGSPKGYDLANPEKFVMPEVLQEISGIAFNKGNSDRIYAQQDEEGKLFYFRPGDKTIQQVQFGKKGDYEDVAIANGYVVMLRSDGVLFTFPVSETEHEKTDNVRKWEGLVPEGEYEGLAFDQKTNRLFVLCKECKKAGKKTVGTILKVNSEGELSKEGSFSIDVKKIEELSHSPKINFRPSALTKNPLTKEWYVLSSINKMLVVTDENWKVKQAYPLNPTLYIQPEGIAFDSKNNLYISNEGDKVFGGNLLKFKYNKK